MIAAAVDALPLQPDGLNLCLACLHPFIQLLDVQIQLIAQLFQTANQRQNIGGIVEIGADFIQRKPQILKAADAAQLREAVDGIVAVAGSTFLYIRLNQSALLIVENDAACHTECFCNFANRK